MWLRIQTLYLLCASVCALLNCGVFPFWKYEFSGAANAEPMFLYGLGNFGRGMGVGVLFWIFNAAVVALGGLPIVTSFLFANRKTQLLLVSICMGISATAMAFGVLIGFALQSKLGSTSVTNVPQIGLLLLGLSAVFLFLSRGGIVKDEEIATAYKRL